ncbi:MAG: glutaminase [Clostridia bacterium]|nr:glutaminase [Clostridia bacterium]
MILRAPAIPLLNIDPNFSIWSVTDKLNESVTRHWTGKNFTIEGKIIIDGKEFLFMGLSDIEKIMQTSVEIEAMTTVYTFENKILKLKVTYFSPRFLDDFYLLSLPVTYMKTEYMIKDGNEHDVKVSVKVSEEICLDKAKESPVAAQLLEIDGKKSLRMGNTVQKPLNRGGDDLRIDWGYFYLTASGNSETSVIEDDMTYVSAKADGNALFVFAYDDIYSMELFGKQLKSYWNKDGEKIETAIEYAFNNYDSLLKKAKEFSDTLFYRSVKAGGEKYAELLLLAYRQTLAAHKIAVDTDGSVIYISKECYSGGMGATVDVSYPSVPLFLLYNTECVKGMMRPIFQYARSDAWPFDYSPHDVGLFPCLNGQFYSNGTDPDRQMPVEECGNMLIMAAAVTVADKDGSFAAENLDLLGKWAQYLVKHGLDPENQLCTDDFAGHLSHNCNLSIKAIMGIASYSIINKILGNSHTAREYMAMAKAMAHKWQENASNGDGSFRLAFESADTFSMKYNAVWDKLFDTDIFCKTILKSELKSNFKHINPYGMPLDNRAAYTKSDWLVWTAVLLDEKEDFEKFIEPLWKAYNYTPSRVPMTDWYDTITSVQSGFQHRTVQGGLYIKLLDYTEKMKI